MGTGARPFGRLRGVEATHLDASGIRDLDRAHLSLWFDAFLGRFAREAVRSGGEALAYRSGGTITALVVTDPVERTASILTRDRTFADAAQRARGPWALYTEFAFQPRGELFHVLAGEPGEPGPTHRFRHVVRPIQFADRDAVVSLLREVYGVVNERWFAAQDGDADQGFLVEDGGRPLGVAWLAVAGRTGRLHSLSVRLPYRRLGIGGDLTAARLLAARGAGIARVLSEVSDRNLPSLELARRFGLRPVGEMFLYPSRGDGPSP